MSTNITDLPYNAKTELPSRDIPRETLDHVVDPQITPTYTPPKVAEYISHEPIREEQSKIDWFMCEFRMPILIAILYFLYDTPSIHSMMARVAPTLFTDSTTGLLVKSVCCGALYYTAIMGSDYLSKP